MKFVLIFALCACFLAVALAEGEIKDPCAKVCPKNFKRVSGLKRDGSCISYNNHCLLAYDVKCQKQEFEKCYRGDGCETQDETKTVKCIRGE